MNKKRNWRGVSDKVAKDKREIYNSREWKELRIRKMQANPICELCEAEGHVAAAQCVHHIHPIEQSSSLQEMRMWAFKWENLQSLCLHHHIEVHKQAGANRKENVAERRQMRQERWRDGMVSRFTNHPPDRDSENPAPCV